ncbi:MAG TPA: trypsin-like peptidase domain-containing protein [Candidatus Limnocylindria bacterium]|nr:trypsin-like peptidase domain-containing protein [Candidatus Limnocylindria bacterium]
MADDHDLRDRDETRPLEIQRYGPPPTRPNQASWQPNGASWQPEQGRQAAPAWSTRAPESGPATTRGPASERRGLPLAGVLVLALVVGSVSGGLSAAAVTNMMDGGSASPTASNGAGTGSTVVSQHLDESSAVIMAVEKVMPAVVTIASQTSNGPFGSASGVGSGFIYNASGWILTNRHVVDGADRLTVQLNDTRVFDAEVKGVDTLTDLAIVKIDARGLPVAPLGSSDSLLLGQLAIAIGNPLGNFENTVTTGVVSGLGRQIRAGDVTQTSSEQLNNLIQTDAAINPGNSGGPLINSAGQVIGINTAVATADRAQGIGFAIPIDIAKPILQQVVQGKTIARPWIGVYYQQITKQLAAEKDLPADDGVLIGTANNAPAVFPGSPADKAGLKDGDVIVAVDGEQLDLKHDLSTLVLPHQPGDVITLRVLRGNSTQEIKVTLGVLPNQQP